MTETTEMRFDLKRPCKDCPFREGAPYHEGVLKDIPKYHSLIEKGKMAHSCHMTDPRSDSPAGQAYKGPVQHCAGLLLMMANDVNLLGDYQAAAWSDGKWKPMDMDRTVKVFKDFGALLKHYLDGWSKKTGRPWRDLLKKDAIL